MFHRERHSHAWTLGVLLTFAVGADLARGQSDSVDASADRRDSIAAGKATYHPDEPAYYHSFVGGAFARADVVIKIVPTAVDGPPPNVPGDVTISGNTLTINQPFPGGERHMWFDIMASDWDPDMTGTTLKAWQVGLDSSGYTTGSLCALAPWQPPCTTDDDCVAVQGPVGTTADVLKGGCNISGVPPNHCAAGFSDGRRPDFIFSGQAYLGGIDQSSLNYRYGATLLITPIPSPHTGDRYIGTLTLKTLCNCPAGNFRVGIGPPDILTNMVDGNNQFIVIGVVGADVIFPEGQCCNISEDPPVCVSDSITRCACEQLGRAGHFAAAFNPAGTCGDACPGCVGDGDCNDHNICTLDLCRESVCNYRAQNNFPCNDGDLCTVSDWCDAGVCVGDPVECPPGQVCDPADGICKLCTSDAQCDDGDPCTEDICGQSGCTNEPNYDDALYCCYPVDGTLCARPADPLGDFDGDGDVDLIDFAVFQTCFGSAPVAGICDGVDLGCDCALDEQDTDDFVTALTGP
jgi:hypothetical protein